MADFASAARNAPSEDGKCWQRVELGLHGLRSSGRNWSRKVRQTRNSGGLQGHEGGRGHLLSGVPEASLAPNVPQAEVSKPREPGCRLAAQYAHGNCVIPIIVGQETWPAHGAAEPGTLWSARSRCTTGLGFCAAR